nr:type II toxin-antitoxin system ParD family antitoxin [Rheinheimera oceanensis]
MISTDATRCVNYSHRGVIIARTTSVTIGPQLDDFVSKLLESGRYGSTSEVMRSALRLLERQENQMAALRQAVAAGEQSGESNLTLSQIADQVKQKHDV